MKEYETPMLVELGTFEEVTGLLARQRPADLQQELSALNNDADA